MRERNRLPQLMMPRLYHTRQRVRACIWSNRQEIDVFGGPENDPPIPLADAAQQEFRPVARGEYFGPPGGGFTQRWFKLRVPAASKNERGRRTLHWVCPGETTVWIDGHPIAGFDPVHSYMRLPDTQAELFLDCSTCQTWMHPGNRTDFPGPRPDQYGLRFDSAFTQVRNETAWSAWWDLKTLVELAEYHLRRRGHRGNSCGYNPEIHEMPAFVRRLLRLLDDACDTFDSDGLEPFAEELRKIYAGFPAEHWQLSAGMVGNAHLDLIHRWPQFQAERKGVHTFANVLHLMEKYPDMTFIQSQPALMEAIRRDAPSLAEAIGKRIAEGRYELTGGFTVEADVMIPCGEALARSLVYGQRLLKELRGGKPNHVAWLPDGFGFSNCLPQLLAQTGIDSFYTQKTGWSQLTRLPDSSFHWRGPDGSSVITHISPSSYLGPRSADQVIEAGNVYRQADVHDEIMVPIGFGDGGGGPSEEICECVKRWSNLTGVPRAAWTSAEAFFERLHQVADELPVWDAELYAEFHRGVATAEGNMKLAYRRAERALRAREAVLSAFSLPAAGYNAWKRVLYVQFHDCLPGPSLKMCFDKVIPEMRDIAVDQLRTAREDLESNTPGNETCIFNPVPVRHTFTCELPEDQLPENWQEGLETNDGHTVGTQELGDGSRVLVQCAAAGLEGLALRSVAGSKTLPGTVEASDTSLYNGVVRAQFDDSGRLSALTIGNHVVALTGPVETVMYHNDPNVYDAWDVDQHNLRGGHVCSPKGKVELVESGPIRARLRTKLEAGGNCDAAIDYILEAGSSWLRVELNVDWREDHKLLKYEIPTAYRGNHVRYGSPFGSVVRDQSAGAIHKEAQWEVSGNRWAVVSNDNGEGLAVVTEAKYGWSCRNGKLGLSLLRAPKNPNPESDMGTHHVRIAIGRHGSGTHDTMLAAAACEWLFSDPVVYTGSPLRPPLSVDNFNSLVPNWVTPAETKEGIILRLHETMGRAGTAQLSVVGEAGLAAVRLDETDETPLDATFDGKSTHAEIPYAPYKIVSILVKR